MKKFFIIAFDIVIIYIGILLAFSIIEGDISKIYTQSFKAFAVISPIIGSLFILFSYIFGLYNSTRQRLSEVVYTVVLTVISLTVVTMSVCYLIGNEALRFPKGVLLTGMAFAGIMLCVCHIVEWRMERKMHGVRNVLVLGKSKSADALARHIKGTHHGIYNVKHVCNENDSDLWNKINSVQIVFLTFRVSEEMRDKVFYYAFERGISVYFVPKYSDIGIINASLHVTDDIPAYRLPKLRLSVEELFMKRTFDLVVSFSALLIFSPLFLLIAFLEKWDGGPVFYTPERLTQGGKIFKVYKFRSKGRNVNQLSGTTDRGDSRLTRLGRFLRATRLDELPLLINIINGDMSIVGPRPEKPFFMDGFVKNIPEYPYRLKVKAGLTGLDQIMGKYNTCATQKLQYDLLYINQYSVLKDMNIVFNAIKIVFLKKGEESLSCLQQEQATSSPYPGVEESTSDF